MGFKTEFNWALKLTPDQGLDEIGLKAGLVCSFCKDDSRTYPVGMPIDLLNESWLPLAKVIILETTNHGSKTSGKYRIVKVYEGDEKRVLANYWRETVQIIKGGTIEDSRRRK